MIAMIMSLYHQAATITKIKKVASVQFSNSSIRQNKNPYDSKPMVTSVTLRSDRCWVKTKHIDTSAVRW